MPLRRIPSPLLIASVGSLLLFAAQPPLGWSLLAWVAPWPWLWLAKSELPRGRWTWIQIWLAGVVYWLLAIHWIRLAHDATWAGWLLLASYLGVYLPVFVAAVRVGVRRLGLPLWAIAPPAWVGVEWLQARLLGGFLMGALGHTQIHWLSLAQISDLGGAYSVSFLVMLVAACLLEMAFAGAHEPYRTSLLRAAVAALLAATALLASVQYGRTRLAELTPADDAPRRRVALIQGNFRAVWNSTESRDAEVMESYLRMSRAAVAEASSEGYSLDLVVWPESMFRAGLFTHEPGYQWPESAQYTLEEVADFGPQELRGFVAAINTPILVGIDRQHGLAADGLAADDPRAYKFYNSAVAVDRSGQLLGTYDKTHLVMFGEYVPGGKWWPGIYNFFPIGGLDAGDRAVAFEIEGVRYMPTICYETVIPHVVRRQVADLAAGGQRPDVLVNVTNDSWFDDSSELEMHLTCSRWRAIECRTPLVVAANGGLSAHIDRCGRLMSVTKPMTEDVLIADVATGASESSYLRYGDWFAIACLIGTSVVAIIGVLPRFRRPH